MAPTERKGLRLTGGFGRLWLLVVAVGGIPMGFSQVRAHGPHETYQWVGLGVIAFCVGFALLVLAFRMPRARDKDSSEKSRNMVLGIGTLGVGGALFGTALRHSDSLWSGLVITALGGFVLALVMFGYAGEENAKTIDESAGRR